jgi:hypothetical protein
MYAVFIGRAVQTVTPAAGSITNSMIASNAAISTTKLGAGAVLQVVQGTHTTSTSNSTITYADTGLTASITPSSASNKILVLISHGGLSKGSANGDSAISIRLVRNSTNVQVLAEQIAYQNLAQRFDLSAFFSYLDSPSTTSATTYKTQFANSNTGAAVTVQSNSIISIITLIEIAG